jgi:hypothetical protein
VRTGGRSAGRTAARRLHCIGLAVLALAVLVGNATAQEADARAIAAYRLSEATLTKFITASRGMAAASRAQRDTVTEDEGPQTIADMAAFYDGQPAARRALAGAGLTSREYVTFMFTLLQAGMGSWLVERQGWDKLPPEIARENVAFYQRHKAQLDSLTAELKSREGDSQ